MYLSYYAESCLNLCTLLHFKKSHDLGDGYCEVREGILDPIKLGLDRCHLCCHDGVEPNWHLSRLHFAKLNLVRSLALRSSEDSSKVRANLVRPSVLVLLIRVSAHLKECGASHIEVAGSVQCGRDQGTCLAEERRQPMPCFWRQNFHVVGGNREYHIIPDRDEEHLEFRVFVVHDRTRRYFLGFFRSRAIN